MPLKWLKVFLLTALVLAAISIPLPSVHAQNDPLPIIDAAYKDLSTRLGKSVVRGGDTTYAWEEIAFGDTSLGCPQPGASYTQVITAGYKITINYGGVAYDYRVKLDGSGMLLCSPGDGALVVVTTVPSTTTSSLPFGPYNLFLNYSLAFVAADGNVAVRNPGAANTTNGAMLTTDSTLQSTFPFNWPTKIYTNLRAAPDNTKLAWIGNVDNTNVVYVSVGGSTPKQIASGVETGLSIAWSPDGAKLAYAVPTKQFNGQAQVYQIQAIAISGDELGTPEYAGTIEFGVGCGGGSPDPADAQYDLDTGFGGFGITLEWTDKGFIHSTGCSGVGLALTSPGGQRVWTVESVGHAKLSPDRSRLVGIQESESLGPFLVLVDAATGAVTSLRASNDPATPIVNIPQQVSWTFDGKDILYATQDAGQNVQGLAGKPVGDQLFTANWPFEAVGRLITLWRMEPRAGATPIKLFQQAGRGIGKITAAPDNVSIAISFTTDSTAIVQRINNGASAAEALQSAPYSSIIRVWLDGGSPPEVFGTGRSPIFMNGQFVANPVALTQPNRNSGSSSAPPSNSVPPALVVGGKAIVTTGDDPLNLRESTSLSALVKRILKQGAVVDVLAGPQGAEGFRWWQVRADDGSIGWVVDQVTDETGTLINTLSPQ